MMGKEMSLKSKRSIIRPAHPFPKWFVPNSQASEGVERGKGHGQPSRGAFPWEKQGWYCGLGDPSTA